jgi:hypothetical protein
MEFIPINILLFVMALVSLHSNTQSHKAIKYISIENVERISLLKNIYKKLFTSMLLSKKSIDTEDP